MSKLLKPRQGNLDVSRPPLPVGASAARRWRFRRDLVIYLAHRHNGLSQRLLADVFDLPRSRIATIIQNFQKYESGRS